MKKKNFLIIIPARAGSERVKNKNIKEFAGKSLLYYKIKSCLKIKEADVLVSTDSPKIANYSKKNGAFVPFLRSKLYSSSKASTSSVILETIKKLNLLKYNLPKYIGVLPATNPFLKSSSVIKALKILKKNFSYNSIIGYCESNDHPFNFIDIKKKQIKFDIIKYQKKKYSQFERTQDWPKSYINSAALKITKIDYFLKKIFNTSPLLQMKTFDMNSCLGLKINNFENFDINNSYDFEIANYLAKTYKKVLLDS